MSRTSPFVAACVATMFCVSAAHACQVPVFRYALEHWDPDRLEVIILHEGEMSDEHQSLVNRLKEAANDEDLQWNGRVTSLDKSQNYQPETVEARLLKAHTDEQLPRILVYFNLISSRPPLAWSAPLQESSVQQLLESPVRNELTTRLLDGQSAVWILLKSGDEAADAIAESTLREQLQRQAQQIELPSLTDLSAEEKFDPTLAVDLRVEFSILTIEPDDPAESFFRASLLATEPDLATLNDQPIAIPVYGRGRTHFALIGRGIAAETVAESCEFICGACSCEVKADNPGFDLLMAADWRSVEPGDWGNATPLPALTGIGSIEALIDTDTNSDSESIANDATKAFTSAPAAQPDGPTSNQLASTTSSPSQDLQEITESLEQSSGAASPARLSWTARILLGWVGLMVCLGLAFTVFRSRQSDV